ncbi:MAG TPA: hypothetical protein VJ964_07220 [Balneolaceae bacterium]|nr:hypothetical protein [Balneolaceae bacterium]
MKRTTKFIALILALGLFSAGSAFAQFTSELQYYRYQDQRGLNVFEAPFQTNVQFNGVEFKVGGANTLQFQGLEHSNSGAVQLLNIGPNFNLATSNMDLDAALGNGLRMHLRAYLTSRHHTEFYVKDGYFQVDRLDFIKEGFLSNVMDHVRLKVGHMEINYGDNHFRRSDNGQAIFNPFVGNYIMDSFTTEVGGEAYYYNSGFLAMFGLTNGKLNQSVIESSNGTPNTKPSIVGKLGFDSQINPDLRFRLTGSIYTTKQSASTYLYGGDRAGSRYYYVLEELGSNTSDHPPFRSGRYDPGFRNELTSFMINPFVKYQGVEFYGVFENATGKALSENNTRTFNQYGAELLYRFGTREQLYVGSRYNMVKGEEQSGNNIDITRINVGGGWFLTQNILAKAEYVNQKYNGFENTSIYSDGRFHGFMLEAVISF